MAEINNLEEHTLNNMISGGELVRLTIEALAYTELRDPIIGFILKDNKGQTLPMTIHIMVIRKTLQILLRHNRQ